MHFDRNSERPRGRGSRPNNTEATRRRVESFEAQKPLQVTDKNPEPSCRQAAIVQLQHQQVADI